MIVYPEFNSNELLLMRVLASLRNTYKGAYGILAVLRNLHHRRSNGGIELEPFDPKLVALITQALFHRFDL